MEKLMTKTEQLFNALANGEELTAKQISSRYGVKNAHNIVYQLRSEGHAIYLNKRTNSKGEVTHKYRLGTPTRAMKKAMKSK
jgi:transcription initiation factor IIE alpha subunit